MKMRKIISIVMMCVMIMSSLPTAMVYAKSNNVKKANSKQSLVKTQNKKKSAKTTKDKTAIKPKPAKKGKIVSKKKSNNKKSVTKKASKKTTTKKNSKSTKKTSNKSVVKETSNNEVKKTSNNTTNNKTNNSESVPKTSNNEVKKENNISTKDNSITKRDFVHTSGAKLVYEDGSEYIIHGMNFGNKMWYNPSEPQTYYNDENSYKELSEMGINTIRYYINYALLEDDNNPGVYKKTGLDWYDKNVEWASKYGIKIIFNIHIPQGAKPADSWDMPSGSLYLFYGKDAKANKQRLNNMWKFLANRYKDNKAVLGYSILNEPVVPFTKDLETSIKIWEDYSQELTDIIRSVDKKHILFVEPTTSVYNTDTQEYSVYDYADSMFVPKDDNVVSEYHFYYPVEFTHQAYNSSYTVGSSVYPNANAVSVGNKEWKDCIFYYRGYDKDTDGFKYVESPLKKVNSLKDVNVAYPAFRTEADKKGWTAYFDDICVKVYDKNNKYVETIMNYDFNTSVDYKVLEGYYDGCVKYSEDSGRNNSGCLVLKDALGEFNVSSDNTYKYFKLKEGYSYKICAYVKVVNPTKTEINVTPTITFEYANEVYGLDKAYLKSKIETFTKFMEKTNYKVPIYMGEFGTFEETYSYGGYKWISDMLDLLTSMKLNFSYHEYRPGLYTGYDDIKDTKRNDEVYNIFKSKLSK